MSSCNKSVYAFTPSQQCWYLSAYVPPKYDFKLNINAFSKINACYADIPICYSSPVYYLPAQAGLLVEDLNNSHFNAVLSGNYIVIDDSPFNFTTTLYSQYFSAFGVTASAYQIQYIQKYISPLDEIVYINKTTNEQYLTIQNNWISANCLSQDPGYTTLYSYVSSISALAKQNQSDIFNTATILSQVYTNLSAAHDLQATQILELSSCNNCLDISVNEIMSMRPGMWLHDSTLICNSQNNSLIGWGDYSENQWYALSSGSGRPTIDRSNRWNVARYATFANHEMSLSSKSWKEVFIVAQPDSNTDWNPIMGYDFSHYMAASIPGSKRPFYAGTALEGWQFGYMGEISTSTPQIITFRVKDIGSVISWQAPQQLVSFGFNGHEFLVRRAKSAPQSKDLLNFFPNKIGSYNSTYFFNGKLSNILAFDHPLSQSERWKVFKHLANRNGIVLPTFKRMVVIGDSIAKGQGVTPAQSLLGQLLGVASSGILNSSEWSGFNGAVGGNMTHDMLGNVHAFEHFMAGSVNVGIIWGGTNNNGTTSVAQTLADISEICRVCREKKGYVVLMAMTPTSSNVESFRTPYNLGLKALVTSGVADLYFDGDALLGSTVYNPNPADWTVYYQNETPKIHPNAAGFSAIATAFAPVLSAFLLNKNPL